MLERIRNYAYYGDTDRESYHEIRSKIEASNRIMTFVFALVAFLLIAVMFFLSFREGGFSSSRRIYIAGMLCSVLIIVVSFLSKKMPILTYVNVYISVSVFMLYGIAIATISRPEEQTVTFMVMLILLPLIFVDRPIRMGIALILYIMAFICAAIETKPIDTLSVDITDALIFGLLSLASESIVNRVKIKGYVLEQRLEKMSLTDQLTGLYNRNCYEWKLSEYVARCRKSLSCIYIDVNGLHELNNSKGHKAGDNMLICIADIVRQLFGKEDTYRIGGDEYVSFAMDKTEDEVRERIVEMKKRVESQGYHVAVGCAFHSISEANADKLIIEAETAMYKDKSEYYRTHDRRSRQ